MFELKEFWFDLVVRSAILYIVVLVVLRLRNRAGGQLSPVDQVTLIMLGDIAANATTRSDDSVSAAVIAMCTLAGLSMMMNYMAFKSKTASKLLEGLPRIIVHNGKVNEDGMAKEGVNRHELMEALREAGVASISQVRVAMVETNGKISVVKMST